MVDGRERAPSFLEFVPRSQRSELVIDAGFRPMLEMLVDARRNVARQCAFVVPNGELGIVSLAQVAMSLLTQGC